MGYWVDRNFSAVEDRTILSLDSRAQRDSYRADAVLAGLHASAVTWRHARFADLMTQEPWRALFGRLLMCPASNALTPQTAAALLRHAGRGI